MRKLLPILGFLALCSGESWAAIAYVNGQSANTQATVTSLATPAFSVTSGNLLAVEVRTSLTTAPTVSDTASNTFTNPAACNVSDPGGDSVFLFYAKNVTGNASDVVTATVASQSFVAIIALQFSGADTTSPFDVCASGDNSATVSSITSGSFTPSAAGNLGVAFTSIGALATTAVAGTGYTIPATIGQSDFVASEYKLSLASGSQTASMSWTGGTGDTQIVVGSFKPAAAGGPTCTSSIALMGVGCR